ncbi:hypothetical protein VTN49DRAFT_664 [Thermomyces lanuginosus]|uniref:uncharacterized protein n=1 Tax=Thermomyces lanuginosus TaxID=5541 RepID=UPI0037422A9F
MPSIPLHPPNPSNPPNLLPSFSSSSSNDNDTSIRPNNPLPSLLQTPSGLAILEIQGTINIGDNLGDIPAIDEQQDNDAENKRNESSTSPSIETELGTLVFPNYHRDEEKNGGAEWMKKVYLYVGRFQRLTGEVKKLPKPVAVIRRRPRQSEEGDGGGNGGEGEELEVVEVVKYKLLFSSRPEPVGVGELGS